MLKIKDFAVVLFMCLIPAVSVTAKRQAVSYADYVNPLVGTDSTYSFSTGNTYPAIALPWGMNFWTPQTNKMGDGWGYQYDAHKIRGFKQTHQPSPWINDYAAFSLMPVVGELIVEQEKRASQLRQTRVAKRMLLPSIFSSTRKLLHPFP